MNALEIVAALIALLITILIFLKKRKQSSSKETLISKPKTPDLVKQQPKIESVDQPIVNAEPTSVNSQITDTTVVFSPEPKPANKPIGNIELSAKPQAIEAAISPAENISSSLPQDSILRRHYLTHLCTMIESLAPPRPTDSVLCRHYYTMIVTTIDQCLNNKKAMEQLIYDYENRKPIGNIEPSAKPQANETAVSPAENISSSLPQDSILRRHYLTHLCTMIESLAPPQPTDSVLCRHYYTMIASKIDHCLNDNKAIEQLIYDYENISA